MFIWLKQMFCKHDYANACEVKTFNDKSYQEFCPTYEHNKCCRTHDEAYNLLEGYCDYYYQKCTKCGKEIRYEG